MIFMLYLQHNDKGWNMNLLTKEVLTQILSEHDLSRRTSLLALLALEKDRPKTITELRDLGKKCGIRTIEKWNLADILSKSKGLCIKLPDGWVLTNKGISKVLEIIPKQNKNIQVVSETFKQLVEKIEDEQTREFLVEAAQCFDSGCYRAAVVLAWVGAIFILQDFIVKNRLDDFNNEASRRYPKWQIAKTTDDLSRMKEKDFLDILVEISVLGKNVKQELEQCLNLRNGCGHPNSLKLGPNRVTSHIETLILNVYLKFTS